MSCCCCWAKSKTKTNSPETVQDVNNSAPSQVHYSHSDIPEQIQQPVAFREIPSQVEAPPVVDPETGESPLSKNIGRSVSETRDVAVGPDNPDDFQRQITLSKSDNMSNTVPAITKPAPSFKGTAVVDGQFKEISLKDYKGKYVILFFYPLDFTFVCPTEIIAFSERADEFKKIGCELIACSTDSHFSHLAWINMPRKEGGLGHMNIPVLADKSMEISRAYGVLKEDEGVAFRGLFIIDDKQNLRQATINDLPVGRDVDEALRLVQAFQFTDTYGEVCPAGWKPGKKTMKADPIGSKDYFQDQK